MRMRTTAILVALLGIALWAAPAEAKLVYVKQAGTVSPVVYVSKDSGKDPRRLGIGRAPTISPNGQWVAFVTVPMGQSEMDTVVLQKLKAGSQRLVMRSKSIDSLRFSPDSQKLAAIAGASRVRVYDIAKDSLRVAAEGNIRGFSFSPDSTQIVFGRAVKADIEAKSDLYTAPALGSGTERRITQNRNALYPVWGPDKIVFDRFKKREGEAPAYNLWTVDAVDPGPLARLTDLTIPPLASGLVPLEQSSDGRRLLSAFTGQDVEVGFTVAMANGRTRALSDDFETGTVGFDLSRDGTTILAHTGGPNPANQHDVVSVPYKRGGETKVIVEDAAYPDWNR
jgi:Tol biopolymer transport system component